MSDNQSKIDQAKKDLIAVMSANSNQMLDEAIKGLKENDVDPWSVALIDEVYRSYVHLVEKAHADEVPIELAIDSISNLVANMINTFVGRVVPRNEMDAAISLNNEIMSKMGGALATMVSAEWSNGHSKERH